MARTYYGKPGGGTSKLAIAVIGVALVSAASGVGGVAASSGTGSVGSYSTASKQALETLWVKAGGSQSSAANAVCHAEQESSGNATVTSSNPDGGTNVGLWQLDTKGVGAGYTVAQLSNPAVNAAITVKATRDGADWSSWATPGC